MFEWFLNAPLKLTHSPLQFFEKFLLEEELGPVFQLFNRMYIFGAKRW